MQFTYVFNVFVMLQLFNFINSRRILDECNVFDRMFANLLFPGIVVGIMAAQIVIVTFAGVAFGLYSNFGLSI